MSLASESMSSDFTGENYRQLIDLARQSYEAASYRCIPWGRRFILWRHDCDYSLNRSLALARIEAEFQMRATYFVNPHSEFYNLLERGQRDCIRKIAELGHDIALHFDTGFYNTLSEADLHEQVGAEADLLEGSLGFRPTAFSFHNPTAFHFSCEADSYGGLLNCYSKRFKTDVPYCSDSNGYWRFRRLRDVLTEASDPCLQVLTHPGWWQEKPMPPRQRIFRSVYGRAAARLRAYDEDLELHGRTNHAGAAANLSFLRAAHPRLFELCDYLWNRRHLQSLYVELWRMYERQINKLCKAELRKQWRVPAFEVNAFFENPSFVIDGWRLFSGVFGRTWQDAVRFEKSEYQSWVDLRNTLIHGRASAPSRRLEDGCIFLCSAIESLSSWGKAQPIQYDGIDHLGAIGVPTCKTADGSLIDRLEEVADDTPNFPVKKWRQFTANMLSVGSDGMVQESAL